jgi:molybdopterin converting factor small subunit
LAIIVHIKMFGLFREAVGKNEIAVALQDEASVADIRGQVNQTYPQLAQTRAYFIIAVNRRVAPDTTKISPSDEIAIMPLVSGG